MAGDKSKIDGASQKEPVRKSARITKSVQSREQQMLDLKNEIQKLKTEKKKLEDKLESANEENHRLKTRKDTIEEWGESLYTEATELEKEYNILKEKEQRERATIDALEGYIRAKGLPVPITIAIGDKQSIMNVLQRIKKNNANIEQEIGQIKQIVELLPDTDREECMKEAGFHETQINQILTPIIQNRSTFTRQDSVIIGNEIFVSLSSDSDEYPQETNLSQKPDFTIKDDLKTTTLGGRVVQCPITTPDKQKQTGPSDGASRY